MSAFFDSVYQIVEMIPFGCVISYGQIALLAGKKNGAREVGWAMRRCPDHLPWHRVVKADGTVTGGMYAPMRRALLAEEGVSFLPDGRVDMAKHQWHGTPK